MPFSRSSFKGFPFDDSNFENRDRSSFHSHLDDIARRHPELEEHLNFDKFKDFPIRHNTWGHNRRGSLFSKDNPESTNNTHQPRFSAQRNSPFVQKFDLKFDNPFDKTSNFQHQQPKQPEKPPQVPTAQEHSRKPNPNVPQSNTVDLGQKQEPLKDIREQRSMSAPPENRAGQQRFVSSIKIPVQNEADAATQTQPQQTKQQKTTNERVIPIHVEGRDEPVMPKNPNQTFNQSQPQADRQFNQRPGGFHGSTWNRGDGPYYTGEPHFNYEQPHNFYNNSHHNDAFNDSVPFMQQKAPPEPQQPQNPPRQPQQMPQQSEPTQPPPPPPPAVKLGPIEQIQRIQKDVLELMNQVEKFNGKPRDKDYVYLDEMLTRNLLKLDDVETEGKDNIRNARKEAIKCIQKCISILEAKANANELLHNQLMDISNAPLTSLQVSGVSRSGTETSVQAESEAPEEQTSVTETENKEAAPMQIEPESAPVPDSTTPSDQDLNSGPTKAENEITTDADMISQESKPNGPSDVPKEQPMEVEEPKEKKDKKKVKKKTEKVEK